MRTCPSCARVIEGDFAFCPHCGAELAGPSTREERKTVTVLFCDVTGSTSLGESVDPEALRSLLARYFERMKAIVEHHGGTVEKFVGDAVMAVFGVPVLHEDDALRAVRAAAEMRDALPELGLRARIGLTTGEVVTGTEERLVTGDTVNVAARLEQAAEPGEVLVGQPTLALVGDAAELEPLEPLELKGKAEPVPAYRLIRVHAAQERRHDAAFVGREQELALVGDAWRRVRGEGRCELVTVVGDAGVGKSRLATEFLASIEATVVRGRCPPYGEGITYWPVVEVLKQLDARPTDRAAAAAIESLLGESDATTSADEIAWAFRKTLEEAAEERPLVALFDDIQWGEQTFRDVIEHVALLSTDAPILLLCLARPELSERSPTWPVALRLEPLANEDVDELLPASIAEELRGRIVRASGGNPLFIHEMLAMAGEADGDVVVPPTLQALLAARLDQLEPDERGVVERGAIEGEVFHRGAVQALAAGGTQVTPRLAALVRKELIRPDRALLAGEDAFRFRHILIRDAAYDALPKAVRADLHQRYASWLEQHGSSLVELDEVAGYHLEQAWRYHNELGRSDDALAEAARRRLTNGGRRAARRQDYHAAQSLFERAAALMPPAEIDLALECELADVLLWTGGTRDAVQRADAHAERAAASGDRLGELCGRILAGILRVYLGEDGADGHLTEVVERALPVFEAAGDDLALYLAYAGRAAVADFGGRADAALEAYERAFAHARLAGHEPSSTVAALAWSRFAGTTPVSDLLAWLDQIERGAGPDQFLRAYRGWSLAKLGRFDEARAIIAQARAEQAERGGGTLLANLTAFESAWVELLAGDPAAAAEFAAEGYRLHEELGEETFLSAAGATLAQALYALDRLDEADAWARRAAAAASTDVWGQMHWRQVQAKLLACRGEHAEAKRLAQEAVTMGDDTDLLDQQAEAYADLAEVLVLGGEPDQAAAALGEALHRFERKGNIVMAGRMRERLSAVRSELS